MRNELIVSGTPIDIQDKKRSIFGHLTTFEDAKLPESRSSKKHILHVNSWYTKGYGDFKVIMKPSVKDRTTFTANDSLGGSQIAQVVSSNVTPEAMKMAGFVADPYAALHYTPESIVGYYVEAQIHGGVSLSDIERIIYTGDQSDKILQLVKSTMNDLNINIPIEGLKPAKAPKAQQDWDAKTGLKTTTAKPIKGRKPGFENWNSQISKLLEGKQGSDPVKGDIVQHKFIKEAGFNGKPTILSQDDFDALEGETLYRGMLSKDHVQHYKESEIQYASYGSFGNGTYSSNKESTAALYIGDDRDNPAKARAERIMEMKLLPDANIFDIPSSKVPDIGGPQYLNFIYELYDEFIEQYKKSGANPAEIQAAEWALKGYTGWTNIAIMKGIDAIRFKAPSTTQDEYYTIILNRGKVAINGKS